MLTTRSSPIIFERWTLTEQMTFYVAAFPPCHLRSTLLSKHFFFLSYAVAQLSAIKPPDLRLSSVQENTPTLFMVFSTGC